MKNIMITYTLTNATAENYKKIYKWANESKMVNGYTWVDETAVVVGSNNSSYDLATDLNEYCKTNRIIISRMFSTDIGNDQAMMGQAKETMEWFGIEGSNTK